MPYARISPFGFPSRQVTITATDHEVLSPMTFTMSGLQFKQQIAFRRVSEAVAEQLATVALSHLYPISETNPPRFQLIQEETDARAIEAFDRAFINDHAKNGVVTTEIIKASYRPKPLPRIKVEAQVAAE